MTRATAGSILGFMSGTSLDGIDAAIIETDGEQIFSFGATHHEPYDASLRHQLQQAIQTPDEEAERWAAEQITAAHIEVAGAMAVKHKVDLIGFHGQTTLHAPAQGITKQIGDGAAMARALGIDVVGDFRTADMAAGGQGAPLAPLYHLALVQKMRIGEPVAIVNIGGVANVTYIDQAAGQLLAFDTGPGNGLLDDWVLRHLGLPFDKDGALAARGKVDRNILDSFLAADYFNAPPPKSLDRHSFSLESQGGLSVEDGAATLCAVTAHTIAAAAKFFPSSPKQWIMCGGGRHNKTLLDNLSALLGQVIKAEKVGWAGDMIEAQCFAFLAMRSVRGLPLSLPSTTGCAQPTSGGQFFSYKG